MSASSSAFGCKLACTAELLSAPTDERVTTFASRGWATQATDGRCEAAAPASEWDERDARGSVGRCHLAHGRLRSSPARRRGRLGLQAREVSLDEEQLLVQHAAAPTGGARGAGREVRADVVV